MERSNIKILLTKFVLAKYYTSFLPKKKKKYYTSLFTKKKYYTSSI